MMSLIITHIHVHVHSIETNDINSVDTYIYYTNYKQCEMCYNYGVCIVFYDLVLTTE